MTDQPKFIYSPLPVTKDAATRVTEPGSYGASVLFPAAFARYAGSSRSGAVQFHIDGAVHLVLVDDDEDRAMQRYGGQFLKAQAAMSDHSTRFVHWKGELTDTQVFDRWGKSTVEAALRKAEEFHGSDFSVHQTTEGPEGTRLYGVWHGSRRVPPKPRSGLTDQYLTWALSPGNTIDGPKPGADTYDHPESAVGIPFRVANVDRFFNDEDGGTTPAIHGVFNVVIGRLWANYSVADRVRFGEHFRAYPDELLPKNLTPTVIKRNKVMREAEEDYLDTHPELRGPLPPIESLQLPATPTSDDDGDFVTVNTPFGPQRRRKRSR